MKIELNITGCKDCPYLKHGYSFGNDGRDGSLVYYCKNGCFGREDSYKGYYNGFSHIPKYPPLKCPYFTSDKYKELATYLNISVENLKHVLSRTNLDLISTKGEQ